MLTSIHRINCGGPSITDTQGNTWVGDSIYTPGGNKIQPSTYISVNPTLEGDEQTYSAVFQTERYTYAGNPITYSLPVGTGGLYEVRMVFMETWRSVVGSRLFDIQVQGSTVFTDVDIFDEAGLQTPLIKTTQVTMNAPGAITLSFVARNGKEGPALYALEVVQQPVPDRRTRRSVDEQEQSSGDVPDNAYFTTLPGTANVPMAAMCALVSLMVLTIVTNLRHYSLNIETATDAHVAEASEPELAVKRRGGEKPLLKRGESKITVNRSFPSV